MTSNASACKASPTRIASLTPKTFHAVGRCRRMPSRSMMSSWMREKLWTISTATAAGTAARQSPEIVLAARRVRSGRRAFPEFASTGLPASSVHPKW